MIGWCANILIVWGWTLMPGRNAWGPLLGALGSILWACWAAGEGVWSLFCIEILLAWLGIVTAYRWSES